MMMYRRFERGLETRNIIIVGTGRVGQAMRHHLDSIRHLGYSFRGYVHIPGVDSENPALAGDILGSIDRVLELARQFFADEIFLSAPCDARVVTRIVTQAREAGVDIRVVPELYDGLAWNSPIEYIGQFPTIPLHRGEAPVIGTVPQAHSRCAALVGCAHRPVAADRGDRGCHHVRFARAHFLLL